MANDLVERLEQAAMENEAASWRRSDIHSLGIGSNLCREAAARITELEKALRPLADQWKEAEDARIEAEVSDHLIACWVDASDLRRAARALKGE